MTFRDESEAILARVRSLSRELEVARREIDTLRRQLSGEPPLDPPFVDPRASAITDELASARALLAGLIGEDEATPGDAAAAAAAAGDEPTLATAAARVPRPEVELLRRALRTSLVRKLGGIDAAVRARIDANDDVEELIELIAEVAVAEGREAALAALR